MIKEERLIFKRVALVVAVFFLLNLVVFSVKIGTGKGLTGFSIQERVTSTYNDTTPISKLFLGVQWLILISLLLSSYVKDKGIMIRKAELQGIDMEKLSRKKGTDLDTLYNLLKEKKQLRVSTIAEAFNVDKKIALEWCKVLESGGLVVLDYPTSKEPIVRLSEK